MATALELKQQAQRILGVYDAKMRDAMYRAEWHSHVKADVIAHAKDINVEIDDDTADFAAELYVYEGEYDCNMSYWDNIEHVIDMARERTS